MSSEEPTRPDLTSPLWELEAKLGESWSALHAAHAKTQELRRRLDAELDDIDDPNCAVIVTGSLARGEANAGSDADWLLLIDGPSNPDHARMARGIDDAVRKAKLKEVGATGTFGDIVVGHELVHYIAGMRDSNLNLTRRMLLLAESHAIRGPEVRKRVIRNVLARYVEHDRSVRDFHPIPHFMLNDVVRYWRTIAFDYASKMWEREHKGWATRNLKLRFSRKLLFAWGLLASFAGDLNPTEVMSGAKEADNPDQFYQLLAELIREQTDVTPLNLLARVALHEDVKPQTQRDLFGSYNQFLWTLSNPEKRDSLDSLAFKDAADDRVYKELRELSGTFRKAMNALFMDEHPELSKLIRDYGVF